MTVAASVVALTSLNMPPYRPTGVRSVEAMTTSRASAVRHRKYLPSVSATSAGLSTPSISITVLTVSCSAGPFSSTAARVATARTREPTLTGEVNRMRFDPVVDRHLRLDAIDLLQQHGKQGGGEPAVRDRRPERPVLCALGVDVDPLEVAGGASELVDPALVDEQPVAAPRTSPTFARSSSAERKTVGADVASRHQ